MKKNQPLIAAVAFSVIIGLSFLFVKIALSYHSQSLILAQRFLFAFLGMLLFLCLRPTSFKLNRQEIKIVAIISFFYPILFFTTQIVGLARTTVTEAGMIQSMAPAVTVLLAALFLQEYTQKKQTFGIILSVAGVFLIQLMSANSHYAFHLFGNLLIIASIFATAIWQILSRKATQTVKPIQITLYIITIGCLFFNAVYFFDNGSVTLYLSSLKNSPYLFALLFLGIFSTLGSSLLSIFAVSQLPVVQVSIFNNLATFITVLSGILILKDPFHFYHLIGGLMIISGVLLVTLKKNSPPKALRRKEN